MRRMAIKGVRGRQSVRIGSESGGKKRKGLSEGKTDKRKRRREGGISWKDKDVRDEATMRWEKFQQRSKMENRRERQTQRTRQ